MKEAKKLFPAHPRKIWPLVNGQEQDFPPLTGEDLREATSKIKTGKAPGPDGIPSVIVKAAIYHEENYVLKTINKIWKKGTFPAVWKTGGLVLIGKPKKGTDTEPTYRPICLLNEMRKLYERFINKKLIENIGRKGGLADAQFGFMGGEVHRRRH